MRHALAAKAGQVGATTALELGMLSRMAGTAREVPRVRGQECRGPLSSKEEGAASVATTWSISAEAHVVLGWALAVHRGNRSRACAGRRQLQSDGESGMRSAATAARASRLSRPLVRPVGGRKARVAAGGPALLHGSTAQRIPPPTRNSVGADVSDVNDFRGYEHQ